MKKSKTEVVSVLIPVTIEYVDQPGARESVLAQLGDTSFNNTLFNTRRVTGANIEHGGYEMRMHSHTLVAIGAVRPGWLPPDDVREPIQIHPDAREALRRLLYDDPRFTAMGYSEFIMRAVERARREGL